MKKKLWLATAILLALLLLVCACNGGTTDGGTTDGGTHTHIPGEWLVDQAPTCTSTGTRHRECTVCGKTLSTETLAVDATAHNYASAWTSDGESHWHKCQNSGCTAVSDKTSHTFGAWVVDKAATCMTTGIRHHDCTVCGKMVSETMSVVATAHNYASDWTTDGESHWHKCQNSGCTSVKDKAPHTYSSIYSADATYMYMACTEKGCTATTSKTAHNMTFSVSGGNATLTKYKGSAASVVIPTTYNGYPVTSIGSSAFRDCSSLTSITIGGSVTSIGSSAFRDCSSLTRITIPNSVTSIGTQAFFGCSKLTRITIPNSVTSIGSSAFYGCSKLTSIMIPNSVTSIGSSAFYGCSKLTSVMIPNSVTSIGSSAFAYCDSLTYNEYGNACYLGNADNPYLYLAKAKSKDVTSCTIHANTRFVGSYAFYWCDSLTSITIPNSVTSIGDGAFSSCSSLTSITIGNSVTSIGDGAFSPCSSLTSITIPNSVTSIGSYAFQHCSDLTSITIGNSVTSIGSYAFRSCESLTYNEYGNAYYLGNENNPYLYLAKAKSQDVTSCTIHANTRLIGSYAFEDCSSLTSITIGNRVTSIGSDAFEYCSSLTSIHFNGTKAQWKAISKGSDWNCNTGAYTIYCTDGTLSK